MKLRWGLGVAACYVLAALATFATGLVPAKPLYDGLAPPQPYQYMKPPPERARDNKQPQGTTARVEFGPEGQAPKSASTPDGQATMILSAFAMPARPGEDHGVISIEPMDPTKLPSPPPGLELQGNAYRVEVRYGSGAALASLEADATLVFRYPIHASTLLFQDGETLKKVPSAEVLTASLQVYATTRQTGTFVIAAPPPEPDGPPTWVYPAGGAFLLVVVASLLYRGRRQRSSGGAKAQGKRPRRPNR